MNVAGAPGDSFGEHGIDELDGWCIFCQFCQIGSRAAQRAPLFTAHEVFHVREQSAQTAMGDNEAVMDRDLPLLHRLGNDGAVSAGKGDAQTLFGIAPNGHFVVLQPVRSEAQLALGC